MTTILIEPMTGSTCTPARSDGRTRFATGALEIETRSVEGRAS